MNTFIFCGIPVEQIYKAQRILNELDLPCQEKFGNSIELLASRLQECRSALAAQVSKRNTEPQPEIAAVEFTVKVPATCRCNMDATYKIRGTISKE